MRFNRFSIFQAGYETYDGGGTYASGTFSPTGTIGGYGYSISGSYYFRSKAYQVGVRYGYVTAGYSNYGGYSAGLTIGMGDFGAAGGSYNFKDRKVSSGLSVNAGYVKDNWNNWFGGPSQPVGQDQRMILAMNQYEEVAPGTYVVNINDEANPIEVTSDFIAKSAEMELKITTKGIGGIYSGGSGAATGLGLGEALTAPITGEPAGIPGVLPRFPIDPIINPTPAW